YRRPWAARRDREGRAEGALALRRAPGAALARRADVARRERRARDGDGRRSDPPARAATGGSLPPRRRARRPPRHAAPLPGAGAQRPRLPGADSLPRPPRRRREPRAIPTPRA